MFDSIASVEYAAVCLYEINGLYMFWTPVAAFTNMV